MSFRICITVGTGVDANGVALSDFVVARGVQRARETLAATFGGYTETATAGGWWDGRQLVEETGRRWIVLVTDGEEAEVEAKAREAAATIAGYFAQACAALEVERVACVAFVEPARAAEVAHVG